MMPILGLAYSPYVPRLIENDPDVFDYVEVPFEMIRHGGGLPASCGKPLLMHSASLDLAATAPVADATLDEVVRQAEIAVAPWVSEHIAYLSATDPQTGAVVDLGFTMAPSFNESTLRRILHGAARFRARTNLPLLLENPPVYLEMPDTTMSLPEFLGALCRESDVDLLLDLSHFCITCNNLGRDAHDELLAVPLERVRQVHLSGYVVDANGDAWDDHVSVASDLEFALLDVVMRRAPVEAITLEYNWSSQFPADVVLSEAARLRSALGRAAVPA